MSITKFATVAAATVAVGASLFAASPAEAGRIKEAPSALDGRIKVAEPTSSLDGRIKGLDGRLAAPVVDSAAMSDGGQRICSSKYSEVPIEVEGSRYRIQPNTCVTIGTHTRIIVLGESYSTAATAGAYDNCKVGYRYYDPARTYVKGFKAKNCYISI